MAKSRTIQLIIAGKDRVSKTLKKITGGLKKWGVGALKITGGLVAGFGAVTVALGVMFNKLAGQIDEQAKMASALGIQNEALGAMRDAAGYAGISVENLSTALRKMSQGVGDAANGIGEAKDALEALGLDAAKLQQMKPEEAFSAIIAELDKIPNGIKKTTLAMDLFGRSGAAMTNLTSKGLKQAQTDAETLGLKLSTAQAKHVEAANDGWARIKNAAGDFLKYITATLAPSVKAGFDKAFEFLKKQDLKAWAEKAGQSIISLAKTMANTLPQILLVILKLIGKIAMGIKGWQMLWQESTIQALGFAATVQGILRFMAEGFRQIFSWINVGGMFDAPIAGLQKFVNEQNAIIRQLEQDRQVTIKQQVETVSDYKKEQAAIDSYKQTIGDLENKLKELAAQEVSGAKKANIAEQSKASAYDSTTAAIDRQIAKIRQLKAAQGKISTGSLQIVPSVESLSSMLEDAEDR
ncbi:MAG: hypothetical protein GQ578_06375 [Desulfuromonadaceae bacterium]|nr:hypothetical protein [Desulfuromonadaceae bacterium]